MINYLKYMKYGCKSVCLSGVEILYDTHTNFIQSDSAWLHVPFPPQSAGIAGVL